MRPQLLLWLAIVAALSSPMLRAQSLENFRWLDLKQQNDVEIIVTRALASEPYTALREIGYVGMATKVAGQLATPATGAPTGNHPERLPVPRDAHLLVVTAERVNPTALPEDDVVRVYDVNQRQITARLLMRGPALHLLGWVRMWREGEPELAATYNDCVDCERTTFFTTFYIDAKTREWKMRWSRSVSGAPIFSEGQEATGAQQIYGLLDDEAGRVVLGAWTHIALPNRPINDIVYSYRVTYYGMREEGVPLAGAEARAFEQRLCAGQGVLFGLADGQDSPVCRAMGITVASQTLATRRRHRSR